MSGLIAIVACADAAPVDGAEFAALCTSYQALRGGCEVDRRAAGAFAVAGVCRPSGAVGWGAESAGDSWALHVGAPGPGGVIGRDPAEMDGQFALIAHNAAAARIDVICDPFALQALHVAERGGRLFISTSALVLARHLRSSPSVLGLETFLCTGPHFGELTHWEGIRRLPPATHLSIHRGDRPRERVYWRPSVDPLVTRLPLAEAARHCVEVATTTFRQRLRGRAGACCDLTGGFDSRLATLLLDRAGMRFATTTNGADDSQDVILGARVATLAGWPWTHGQLEAGWTGHSGDAVASAVAWGDGQMEASQLAEVLVLQSRLRPACTTLFGGGGGEHWRDYAWQQEIPAGGRTKKVNFERWVNVRFLHPQDLTPLRNDPTDGVRTDLIERCRAYAAPFADLLNSAQLDMLYAYKSMGHFGAYQSASRGTIHVELPFYYRDAFSAPFSVAPRHRNSHRLMRQAVPMLDEQIARIATTVGGPAEPFSARNAHRFLPYLANRASGVARKLTERLPGPTIAAIRAPVAATVLETRQRLLDELIAGTALDPIRMRAGRLYDGRRLALLAGSATAITGGWTTLGRIITVELALEAADASLD